MEQSTADDPPLTPPPVDKDASLFIEAAQTGRVISPHVPSTPNSDHQPTPSASSAAEKETSESALSLLLLGSAAGQTCMYACGTVPSLKSCIPCPSCTDEPLKPVSGDPTLRERDIFAQKVNGKYSCDGLA